MANDHIADDRKKVRLIDANALIKDIDNYYHNSPFPHPGTTWLRGLELAVGLLLKAPTVDAVEVVHGRWLPDMEVFDADPAVGIPGGVFQTGWKCSICGRSEPCKEPYCNCGAKMDGDGNV